MLMQFKCKMQKDYSYKSMTGSGSVGYRKLKFREVLTEKFKQYYPQTLELTSVYNSGSLHVSAKWEEKKNF